MRRTLLILLLCMAFASANATHIIGGELTYTHLGSAQYLVSLVIYRDCGPANSNATGFDATVEIGAYDGTGNYLFSSFIDFDVATQVPVVLNNPCLTAPPSICVERSAYVDTIALPPLAGGYTLVYQRCCRSPAVLNLAAPATQGLTCSVQVPDPSVGVDSSPSFTGYPPIALCANESLVFDHSAFDPDGDVLVYELCAPYNGGGQGNPMPSPPLPPPYTAVNWSTGYGVTNMINGAPGLAIDAGTGQLTVTPTLIGSFTVGLCVKEFRNGQMLSEVRRDLRFDVVPCQVNVTSAIQPQQDLCDGLTVDLVNLSSSSGSYFWDFGVPGTNADTSGLFAPSFTFPDTGVYTIMLIAEPGWPCADTAFAQFEMYLPLSPSFVPPPIQCMDALPMDLQALGNFTSAASVQWDLGGVGVPPIAMGSSVQVGVSQPGTHAVQLTISDHGCTDSYVDSIRAFPNPTVSFTSDTAGCTPLSISFIGGGTAWTPLFYRWDFGDGGTSTDQFPVHVYPNPGSYSVNLEVRTDSGCVDTTSLLKPDLITAYYPPNAAFTVTPPTVNIMDPTVLFTDASTDAVQWTYFVDGVQYTTPDATHTFLDGGAYTVTLVVASGLSCTDTARVEVLVLDDIFHAPNAFSPNGDGVNDEFLPSVLGAQEYELLIYDRWGSVLFSSRDRTQGWSGNDSPTGVYTYQVRYSTVRSANRLYMGSVTLVR